MFLINCTVTGVFGSIGNGADGASTRQLWSHGLRVGLMARAMGQAEGWDTTLLDDTLVGGLLQDVGRLASRLECRAPGSDDLIAIHGAP